MLLPYNDTYIGGVIQRKRAEHTVSKWSEYLGLWKEIKSGQQSEENPDVFF